MVSIDAKLLNRCKTYDGRDRSKFGPWRFGFEAMINKTSKEMYKHMKDEYDGKRYTDYLEHRANVSKRLAGEFKKSNFFDAGATVDEFGMPKIKSRRQHKSQLPD